MRHVIFVGAALGFAMGSALAEPKQTGKAVASTPQQTTATFGDWTLRCSRPIGAPKACELAQGVQRDGKAVAEMAIGSIGRGQRLHFTLLVPTSVSFGTAPALTPSEDGTGLALIWRRCLPGGCIADAEIGNDAMSRLRGWTQPARVVFADGAGRATTIPVSATGLPQALDALAKEDAE